MPNLDEQNIRSLLDDLILYAVPMEYIDALEKLLYRLRDLEQN
jgi:hypothetical protein